MKKIALFLILAALVGLNVVSHSQNQPPQNTVEKGDQEGQFTLKTATEIVLVNVTVRDKNNNAVKDLKLQDFTVLEDGKKQDVISVDAENTDSIVTSEVPKTELLTNLTTATAKTNTAQPATAPAPTPIDVNELKDRRLIVLFFDLSSMQPEEIERATKSALDYADKQMSPADLVSVVTLSNSLKVDLDFTSDKESLKTVMNAFNNGTNEGLGDGATADPNADPNDNSDATNAFNPDETEYNIFNTDRRLQALVSLADDLRAVPQKKSVIYFSGGVQRTGTENESQLRAAINAATKANLSFYTVDVRGLQAIIPGGNAAGGGARGGGGGRGGGSSTYSGRGVLSQYSSNFSSQETLVTLANDTGGKAFLDSNDFTPAFTQVQEDTSFYYLLGYISNNPQRDGRYRRITVRLNRSEFKDARLDFRKGYYAAADFQHSTKETREQQLQDQLIADVPTSDFPVYVSTGYFRMGDNRYFVPVSVVVPGSQIPFTRASEQDRATLDLIAIMRDEAKRPFGTIRDTVRLAVNTSQDVQRKNVQYDGGFLLPPGKYSVKFVVRENQTGRMGSFEAAVNVPDLKAAPVKVSSVVLSNQKQPAKQKNNPLVREGSEIVPNVTHVFSSSQHLYLYYEVYDPTKPTEATDKTAARVLTNVAFYKGELKAYETPILQANEVNVPDRKATAFELDVPLSELKPGFYTCQINVVDDAAGKFVFPRVALLVR
jgi:VWFA-related protein